ncbi:hypothetical protein [Methanobacterium alcaliphilum]|uniref:hypothetical protein n=1 Tax=Methanobacterium alcaliphilum TaxID=392018 RepID=UPI00200AB3F8|nr:hypothetical protein [Methanobacterium alcaliphilum]MCK9151544.1 hypothetical protein [Methanobacterium alcaliphilum]
MNIDINPEIKPLYANLLRLGIAKYLITQRFDHLCIENNLDQLWERCESHVMRLSNVAMLIPGFTGYATGALGIFLEQLRELSDEQFLDLVGKIITDFIDWNNQEMDLSKVKESLVNLGYDSYKIDNIIQYKENPSIESPPPQEIFELENNELEVDEKLCFVLMPFDDKFDSIYENIIKKVVEGNEFKLNCRRADEIFGTGPIIEDIWKYIKKARILVAELTGRNPNVFYELGLAHAMSKEVILITQNLDDVPFDLKHYRCLVYEDSIMGAEKLEKALKNTLRDKFAE